MGDVPSAASQAQRVGPWTSLRSQVFTRVHDSQDPLPTLCVDLSGVPHPIALSARAREQSSLQAAFNLHEKMSRDFRSGAQGDPLQPVWPP